MICSLILGSVIELRADNGRDKTEQSRKSRHERGAKLAKRNHGPRAINMVEVKIWGVTLFSYVKDREYRHSRAKRLVKRNHSVERPTQEIFIGGLGGCKNSGKNHDHSNRDYSPREGLIKDTGKNYNTYGNR